MDIRLEGQTGTPRYMTEPEGPRVWGWSKGGVIVEVCNERGSLWMRTRHRGSKNWTKWQMMQTGEQPA